LEVFGNQKNCGGSTPPQLGSWLEGDWSRPVLLVTKVFSNNQTEVKLMPILGKRSLEVLATCHPSLQMIIQEAIRVFDFTVVCGRRGEKEQEKAFREGKSKLHYPESKHNAETPTLSKAVDLAPYRDGKIQWDDREAFVFLAGVMKAIAMTKGVPLRWGGDFNRNDNLHDDKFVDYPHFELES